MPIPKYRYVEYTDDGCGLSQCLNCYQTWEGRGTHGWTFCPYCGIKWDGQHECRSHTDPAWEYKLNRNSHERFLSRREMPRMTKGWVIEKRSCHMENGQPIYGKWELHARQPEYSRHDIDTLRYVVGYLRSYRDMAKTDRECRLAQCQDIDGFWNHWEEYRASIRTFGHWEQNSMTYIWWHRNCQGKTLVEEWNWTPPEQT